MAGDASVLKDEIEKIQDALGEADDGDADYDSDEPTEDQLFIDLGLSSKDRTSTYRDVSSASTSGFTGTSFEESLITDEDSKSQVYSITDSTVESNTTELPVDVETCLALNRAYQEIITEHLDQIKKSLQENRDKQRLLELNLEEGMKAPKENKFKKPKDYTLPFFSDDNGIGPPPNEDVKIKHFLQEKKQDVCISAAWTIVAQRQLINSVCKDALRNIIQPLMNKREFLENKRQLPNCENKGEINQAIEELDEQIKKKSRTKNEKLLEDIDCDKVDWMRISTVDFGGKREWFECQKMWETAINPKINKAEWKKSEEMKLEQLVEKYGTGHWEEIVEELGTKRSPFQAMQYYQTNMNDALKHRTWRGEEDDALREAYIRNKDVQADKVRWQRISYLMEARSADQCRKRWISADPSVKHTKWTPEEDVRLMLAVKLLGSKDWRSCSKYIPQRNASQCRERYCNYLDPSLKLGKPFTYDEDKKLLKLVKEFGAGCWSKMVPHMPGRTDNNLLSRYKKLHQWKLTANWFHKQPRDVKRMMQGVPAKKGRGSEKPQVDWKLYYRDYGLLPEHYDQQEKDRQENGEDDVVPLPPLLQFPPRGPKFKTLIKYQDRLAMSNFIDNTLERQGLNEAEKEKQKIDLLLKMEMEDDTSPALSVKKLISMARRAPHEKQINRRNRCSTRSQVYKDLCSIVRGPDKKPGSVGRPKRFFPVQPPPDEVEEKKVSVSILTVVNQALAVDGKEILKTAEQKSKSVTKSYQQEKDLAILQEVVFKDGSYINSNPDVESDEDSVPLDVLSTPETGGRRTRKSVGSKKQYANEPTTSATPILIDDDIPSPSTSEVPSTPKVTSATSTMPSKSSAESRVISPSPSAAPSVSSATSTPSTSKPKNVPEELPLLPPNVSNLRGFKSLLLARPQLVKRAGNCYKMIRGEQIPKPLKSFLRPHPKPFTEIKPVPKVSKSTPKQSQIVTKEKKDCPTSENATPKKNTNATSVSATPKKNINLTQNSTIYENPKSKADSVQSVQVIYVYPKAQLEEADIVVPEDKMVGNPSNNIDTVHIRKNLTLEEEETEKKTFLEKTNKKKTNKMKKSKDNNNIVVTNAADDSIVCHIITNSNIEVSSEEKMMNSIRESDDYKRLRARFQSIFMWPALLSSTYSQPKTQQDAQDEQILNELKDSLSKRFGVYRGPESPDQNDPQYVKRKRGRPRIYPKLTPDPLEESANNPDEEKSGKGDNSIDGGTPGKRARGRPIGSKTREKVMPEIRRHSARHETMQQPVYTPAKKSTETPKSVDFHSYCFTGMKMLPSQKKFHPMNLKTENEDEEISSEGNSCTEFDEETSASKTDSRDLDPVNTGTSDLDTKTVNEACDLDPLKTGTSDLNTKAVSEACNFDPLKTEASDHDPLKTEASDLDSKIVNTEISDKPSVTKEGEPIDFEIDVQPSKRKRGRPPKPRTLVEEVDQKIKEPRKRGRPKKKKSNNIVKIEFNTVADDKSHDILDTDQSQSEEQTEINQSESVEQNNSNGMDAVSQDIKKEGNQADVNSETDQSNSAMDESNQSKPLVVKLEFKPLTTIMSDKETDQSKVEIKQEAGVNSEIIEMDQSEMDNVDGVVIKQEVIMEAMEES